MLTPETLQVTAKQCDVLVKTTMCAVCKDTLVLGGRKGKKGQDDVGAKFGFTALPSHQGLVLPRPSVGCRKLAAWPSRASGERERQRSLSVLIFCALCRIDRRRHGSKTQRRRRCRYGEMSQRSQWCWNSLTFFPDTRTIHLVVAYHSGLCCFPRCFNSWNVSSAYAAQSDAHADSFSALHYEKIVQNEHFVRLGS